MGKRRKRPGTFIEFSLQSKSAQAGEPQVLISTPSCPLGHSALQDKSPPRAVCLLTRQPGGSKERAGEKAVAPGALCWPAQGTVVLRRSCTLRFPEPEKTKTLR